MKSEEILMDLWPVSAKLTVSDKYMISADPTWILKTISRIIIESFIFIIYHLTYLHDWEGNYLSFL